MAEIAAIMDEAIRNREGDLSSLKARVKALCAKHPLY